MSTHSTDTVADAYSDLLPRQPLEAWLGTQDGLGTGPITALTKLAGGMQNSVFLIERGDARFVLRRPGKRVSPKSNATMLREARLLRAIDGSGVPHPDVFAVCADEGVVGAAFYCMAPVEGFAPGGPLKGDYATDASWRRAMSEELARAAAALAAIDVEAVGIADIGRPDNWHERQVERWRSQLEGYTTNFPDYRPDELPHFDEVGRWLSANLPSGRRIGLVHGDFQFANVMFSLRQPRISGVVDWELASLGDPLLDLGWVLTSWTEDGDPPGRKPLVQPWADFLSRADLIRLYGDLTGRDMGEADWFFVLACYKLACLLEGTVAASRGGKVPAEVGAHVHAYASWLTTKARQIIAG